MRAPIFLKRTTQTNARTHRALYQCDCGKTFDAIMNNVKNGRTRSCGCDCRRRKAALYAFRGEQLPMQEIVKRAGCSLTPLAVSRRMRNGLSIDDALSLPPYEEQRTRWGRRAADQLSRSAPNSPEA